MKIIRSLCFFGITFFFSCSTYMHPSTLGNDVFYKIRPMVADSINSVVNVTAGISGKGGINDETGLTLGFGTLSRGHTYKRLNFSYGILGYFGKAENSHIRDKNSAENWPEPFKKSTSGLGVQTSIGYHTTSKKGNTDFRIINWENSLTREFGNYAKLRHALFGDVSYERLIVSNNELLWTTGVSSEIIFHPVSNKDLKHAFKLFIGSSPNLSGSFDYNIKPRKIDIFRNGASGSYFQFSYHFQMKKFSLATSVDFSNYSSSFGLGYTL